MHEMNNPEPGQISEKQRRKEDIHFVARVLARKDDATIMEKEAILKNVLAKTASSESKFRQPHGWAMHISVGAGVLCMVMIGLWMWNNKNSIAPFSHEPEFTPKSAGGTAAFFEVFCIQTTEQTQCRPGAKLTFRLQTDPNRHYFSAIAIRQIDNAVIWMFPKNNSGTSLALHSTSAPLQDGILMDEQYPIGKYKVIGLLSDKALRQPQIKDAVLQYIEKGSDREHANQLTGTKVSHVFFEVKEKQ